MTERILPNPDSEASGFNLDKFNEVQARLQECIERRDFAGVVAMLNTPEMIQAATDPMVGESYLHELPKQMIAIANTERGLEIIREALQKSPQELFDALCDNPEVLKLIMFNRANRQKVLDRLRAGVELVPASETKEHKVETIEELTLSLESKLDSMNPNTKIFVENLLIVAKAAQLENLNDWLDKDFGGNAARIDVYINRMPPVCGFVNEDEIAFYNEVNREIVILQGMLRFQMVKDGVEVIVPSSGDEYNEELQYFDEHLEDRFSEEINKDKHGRVSRTLRPGYRTKSGHLRQAIVRRWVYQPPASSPDQPVSNYGLLRQAQESKRKPTDEKPE